MRNAHAATYARGERQRATSGLSKVKAAPRASRAVWRACWGAAPAHRPGRPPGSAGALTAR
eukprot:4949205-Prymnesium_polylepis.1